MNSPEQREFEYITPTGEDVKETIALLHIKLESREMQFPAHDALRQGYQAAIALLEKNKNSYEDIPPSLETDTSRAIAVLTVDYLNGECSRETLMEFGGR
jgi:hypothetical protein